jgi:hypothetical protein
MNAYARLALFLGIAMASLVFVTQYATHRGDQLSVLLQEKKAKAPLAAGTASEPAQRTSSVAHSSPAQVDLFAQLAALPAGAESVTLTQQLESGITAQNAGQYVQALLSTEHPGILRASHAALARTADSGTISQLAQSYGQIPEERRGRVLQVLEQAQNPAAYQGLVDTVRADTSEKRSPILVSAMLGLANVGSRESVSYLMSQLTGPNEFFAAQALRQVNSTQGLDLMQAAAAGNKDGEALGAHGRQLLQEIVGRNR